MVFSRVLAFFMALSFSALVANQTKADTVFYCSDELTAGLVKKNGVWKQSNFETYRHTLKITGQFDKITKDDRIYDCRPAYSETYKAHKVTCLLSALVRDGAVYEVGGLPELFVFNTQTMRYTFFDGSVGGYSENKTEADTETISGGKCEKF